MNDSWVQLVGNLGFPIAVTAYLLISFAPKIERMTESNIELKEAIRELIQELRNGKT